MRDSKDQSEPGPAYSHSERPTFVVVIKAGGSNDLRWDRVLGRIGNVCVILTFVLALTVAIRGW